jgi:LPXTG-site transpeptidase (sortase) family protein
MVNIRNTLTAGNASLARILTLVLVPGVVLLVLILVLQSGEATGSRPPIVIVPATAVHPAQSVGGEPANTATTSIPAADQSTPDVSIPTAVTSPPVAALTPEPPSMSVSSTATPQAIAFSTVVPLTTTVPMAVPPTAADPTVSPAPTGLPASHAPTARLVVPSIGVNAAVETKSVDQDGTMQSPSGPDVASWYDFSSQPGGSGNSVYAGHLDYAGYGPAVFWYLGELQPGDVIEVHLQDGSVLTYHVSAVQIFAASDDASSVVASSGRPTITLITCDGAFDSDGRSYDKRLVVTGDRVN